MISVITLLLLSTVELEIGHDLYRKGYELYGLVVGVFGAMLFGLALALETL